MIDGIHLVLVVGPNSKRDAGRRGRQADIRIEWIVDTVVSLIGTNVAALVIVRSPTRARSDVATTRVVAVLHATGNEQTRVSLGGMFSPFMVVLVAGLCSCP